MMQTIKCRWVKKFNAFIRGVDTMNRYLKTVFVFLVLLLPARSNAGLAEFAFCPLGGPPGWFNRLTGQHNKRSYYPPPVYPVYYPAMQAVPVYAYPVSRPVNPAYYRLFR